MFNPWLALTFKTIQLGIEAQSVIALRLMRFAVGGGARGQDEARRIVVEKIAAVLAAQTAAASVIMTARKHTVVASKVVRDFKKRVHANRRRLSVRRPYRR